MAPSGTTAKARFWIVAHWAVLARLLLRELAGQNRNSPARRSRPATHLRIRGSSSAEDYAEDFYIEPTISRERASTEAPI